MTIRPRIDPCTPVHRQPTFTVRPLGDCAYHRWHAVRPNGVECTKCGALLLALDGTYGYAGRHRLWSPFGDDGHIRYAELSREGWFTLGALREGG